MFWICLALLVRCLHNHYVTNWRAFLFYVKSTLILFWSDEPHLVGNHIKTSCFTLACCRYILSDGIDFTEKLLDEVAPSSLGAVAWLTSWDNAISRFLIEKWVFRSVLMYYFNLEKHAWKSDRVASGKGWKHKRGLVYRK